MIEDYYKILYLTPKSGLFKIARQYRKLSKNLLINPINTDAKKETFFKINRAFEILRQEKVKKYYDILYHEQIINNSVNPNTSALQKYYKIIETYKSIGNQKAEKLINDQNYLEQSGIKKSMFSLLFDIHYIFGGPGSGFTYSPIFGLCYFLIGFIFVLKQIWGLNVPYLIPGIFLFLLGFIVLYFNYRQFIIDKMNEENDC